MTIKTKIIKQSELTSSCWTIQIWGIEKCKECEYLNSADCGGKDIRKLIKERKFPSTGLPKYQ